MVTTKSPDFVISRVLDAPRELVWKCFTDPERMKQWWGPKGFVVIASKMDLRVGGTYHYGMEGQRFANVEVRRGDLRWPLPKGFARTLHGKMVAALGRRAKYLLADLSSGDVLLMHLGMSGSFRVGKDSAPGKYYHERSKSTAHDHVVFHMSNGATVTFNDPRRFGSMR